MLCPECEQLRLERGRQLRLRNLAILNLNAVATTADASQIMRLKRLADDAKVDLDLTDEEIEHHQRSHEFVTRNSAGR